MLKVNIVKQLNFFELKADFWVAKDEILVLWGPSGSGKSTILRCITGIAKPDCGCISLAGQELFDTAKNINLRARDRRVGLVFQDFALFPHMTVAENVTYAKKSKGKRTERDWLELFGIGHLAKSYPKKLSGGEQQRVSVARALATEPQILLLDEPFSALDAEIRADMRKELKELHKKWQIPFILVTHDPQDAEILGDVVIRLEKGQAKRV